MYDMATRVGLVKKRVRQKRHRQNKRALCGLSALCLLLPVSLAGTIGAFTGSGHSATLSMYGSILLHEDAGGYVLVGVMSFAAAAVITLLCIRSREKAKNAKKKDHIMEKSE